MIVLIYGSLHPGVMTRCPMFWSRAFFLSNITCMMWLLPMGSGPPHVFFIWQRGHKAFIDLEYAKFDPNLHTQLFAKHLGQVWGVWWPEEWKYENSWKTWVCWECWGYPLVPGLSSWVKMMSWSSMFEGWTTVYCFVPSITDLSHLITHIVPVWSCNLFCCWLEDLQHQSDSFCGLPTTLRTAVQGNHSDDLSLFYTCIMYCQICYT